MESFIGLANAAFRASAEQKVEELNYRLTREFGSDPLVNRGLPIKLKITETKNHYLTGKAAVHSRLSREYQVREGIHVDDSPVICDAFAARWGTEARVFRIQYRDVRYDRTPHRNPTACYRSGEAALRRILQHPNIDALCARAQVSHR